MCCSSCHRHRFCTPFRAPTAGCQWPATCAEVSPPGVSLPFLDQIFPDRRSLCSIRKGWSSLHVWPVMHGLGYWRCARGLVLSAERGCRDSAEDHRDLRGIARAVGGPGDPCRARAVFGSGQARRVCAAGRAGGNAQILREAQQSVRLHGRGRPERRGKVDDRVARAAGAGQRRTHRADRETVSNSTGTQTTRSDGSAPAIRVVEVAVGHLYAVEGRGPR
mmetsp:Transcript_25290/g.81797  ORF Transcript_25290/g.81797 Transcript_25290/m.81797 type:complete len:220 (-) Transcript_25290:803-1462(-)